MRLFFITKPSVSRVTVLAGPVPYPYSGFSFSCVLPVLLKCLFQSVTRWEITKCVFLLRLTSPILLHQPDSILSASTWGDLFPVLLPLWVSGHVSRAWCV